MTVSSSLPASFKQLVDVINNEVLSYQGDHETVIQSLNSLEQSHSGSLTFLQDTRLIALLKSKKPTAVIVNQEIAEKISTEYSGGIIIANEPMSVFMKLLQAFKPVRTSSLTGISSSANISPKAKIGANCTIGPFAVIEDDVEIGSWCYIGSGVSVGAGSIIGEGTTLYARAVIYPETQIGKHAIIHSGAVIGADGFGYRFHQGEFHKLPHHGRVVIGDHVEIGANTTIDRGMIDVTSIGKGTKIDNLVMIAHNCRIGQHNVIASQVGIAGSCEVGNYCQFGGKAGIADHLTIGDQCQIGANAGVHKNIPSGEAHIGNPAGNVKEQRKILMTLQRLPEIRDKVKQLEVEVNELKKSSSHSALQITDSNRNSEKAA